MTQPFWSAVAKKAADKSWWLVALLLASSTQTPSADLLLTNGRVWTGDDKQPWARAVAIQGNRIVAVCGSGSLACRAEANPGAKVIDLQGRSAMPGINDAHIHFLGGALGRFEIDLTGSQSLEEIQAKVAAFAKAHPQAAWITGGGWEYYVFPGKRMPTRGDLDTVVKDRPVFLRAYDGHTAWVNTEAIRVAGLSRDSKFTGFGELVLDAQTGEPTGLLKEGAMNLVREKIPKPSREKKLLALGEGLRMAASLGITSIQNASGDEEQLELYEELARQGKLTLRVFFAMSIDPEKAAEEIARLRELTRKYAGPLIRVGAAKLMLDGVIETHTAAMLEPYADQPETSGSATLSVQQISGLVAQLDGAGIQIYTHAIGDRAVRMALDAYEHALKVNGPRDARFRIEHIETIHAADLARFARIGVLASMMPIHADPSSVEVWSRAVGASRLPLAFAWRSLEKAGARVVFSSDWPACLSVDPMRGLHIAVNRRTAGGQPPGGWIPAQRVSLGSALRAYTSGAAFAEFQENSKGRIAPGFLADLIVLSQDPFRIDPLRLSQTKVVLTVFDGRIVYQ